MYAVIESGGIQIKVAEGDSVKVPLMNTESGEKIDLEKVMLISKDGDVTIGKPYIEGATVTAEVTGMGKDDKVTVFKFKRRVKYRVKTGHRQQFTELKITGINTGH